MIDLVIAYLALIVVVLLFIVVFLTLYIIYDRRKTLSLPSSLNEKNRLVPLFALQSTGGPGGDHSNSSALSTSTKRTSKRIRYRVKCLSSVISLFYRFVSSHRLCWFGNRTPKVFSYLVVICSSRTRIAMHQRNHVDRWLVIISLLCVCLTWMSSVDEREREREDERSGVDVMFILQSLRISIYLEENVSGTDRREKWNSTMVNEVVARIGRFLCIVVVFQTLRESLRDDVEHNPRCSALSLTYDSHETFATRNRR